MSWLSTNPPFYHYKLKQIHNLWSICNSYQSNSTIYLIVKDWGELNESVLYAEAVPLTT
jgi:hypothetical protein